MDRFAFELGRRAALSVPAAGIEKRAIAFLPLIGLGISALSRALPWIGRAAIPWIARNLPRVFGRLRLGSSPINPGRAFARGMSAAGRKIGRNWLARLGSFRNPPGVKGPNLDNLWLPWMITDAMMPLGPLAMNSTIGQAAMLYRYPKFGLGMMALDKAMRGGQPETEIASGNQEIPPAAYAAGINPAVMGQRGYSTSGFGAPSGTEYSMFG